MTSHVGLAVTSGPAFGHAPELLLTRSPRACPTSSNGPVLGQYLPSNGLSVQRPTQTMLVYSYRPKPAMASGTATTSVKPMGPVSAQDALLDGLCLFPMVSILGQRPVASASFRRRKELLGDFTLRRRVWLGSQDDDTSKGPYHRAQSLFLKRLSII